MNPPGTGLFRELKDALNKSVQDLPGDTSLYHRNLWLEEVP